MEQPVGYVLYHSESLIKEIRAGSSFTDAVWLFLYIWMLQHQSIGFQPVQPIRQPPHIEGRNHLLFGNPKIDRFSSQNRVPSRSLTVLESKKGHHPDNKFYNSEVGCYFTDRQLQKKYKHARVFGVRDRNYNPVNGKAFEKALVDHMKLVGKPIDGSYHKKDVYHYYDDITKLNVMINKDDKTFISSWELNDKQIIHMKNGGNL